MYTTTAYEKIKMLVVLVTILTLHSDIKVSHQIMPMYTQTHTYICVQSMLGMDSTIQVTRHMQATVLHTNTHSGSDTFQNSPVKLHTCTNFWAISTW
jgi:capsular polysaccharide biosynthesis protein